MHSLPRAACVRILHLSTSEPYMSRKTLAIIAVIFSFGLLTVQCSVPVRDLYESFSIQVLDKQDNNDPVKIDFVWVIDNSNSMCEEQSVLTKNFDAFATQLQDFISIDARMAVVTTDVLTEHGTFSSKTATAFPPPCRRELIKKCLTDEDCLKDAEDSLALPELTGESNWTCTWSNKEAPTVVDFEDALTLTNANGSVNSRCQLVCASDEVCQDFLGEDLLCKLYNPELKLANGCMVPPPADECPANLPKYIELNSKVSNIDQFRCLATVGANSGFNANLEQGLNAARFALDPNGPNSGQAKDFLRSDAWLVLIFVSDEDDCSLATDCLLTQSGEEWSWNDIDYIKENCLLREEYPRCAQLGDVYGKGARDLIQCYSDDDCSTENDETNQCCKKLIGDSCIKPVETTDPPERGYCTSPKFPPEAGPLEPVSRLVNFFKSLKSDPARVLVASIVGDSQEVDVDTKLSEIEAYHFSEANDGHYAPRTFICSSENGIADHGSRYIELAESFGPNGIVANICGPKSCTDTDACPEGAVCALVANGGCEVVPEGIDLATYGTGKALELISETIIRRVVRICLPRPLKCINQDMYCTSGCPDGACGTLESCVGVGGEWLQGQCLEYVDLKVQRIQCAETDPDNPSKCGTAAAPVNLVQTNELAPGAGEYLIQEDGTCSTTGLAVFFGDLLDPLDSVLVQYEGDVGEATQ